MNGRNLLVLFFLLLLKPGLLSAQNLNESTSNHVLDSLKKAGIIFGDFQRKPDISLSVNQAVKFLQQRYQSQYWNSLTDPLRVALGQLIFNATNPPFDSLAIPWDKFYIWEPMRLRMPVSVIQQIPRQNQALPQDTAGIVRDSVRISFDNPPLPEYSFREVTVQKDTSIMVVIDTLHEVTSNYSGFPFRYFNYPYQSDSLRVAVKSLLDYLQDRDSSVVYFTGKDNQVTPVWLNSRSSKFYRYWLKNDLNDSVTVWIGNPARDTFSLYLEKEVTFKRPPKQSNYSDARINVKEVDKSTLLEVQKVYIKPRYWKHRLEANFVMSQTALSNWIRGGENSFSTSMDITEFANYENKDLNLSSGNFFRIKMGFIKSGDKDIQKNLDLLETNSKLNHKAFGKFDFSAIMLFKTQLAPGKNYSTDPATEVSRFFNPATLTLGIGLDYKPNKTTSINFSPLSYKGTYMTDTVTLDQTIYGIPKDKKALHEPGISFLVSNEFHPTKSISIINRLQLFTNYINNPQNIDVDWELIATANLNWFTDVRLNTHLIYDDDSKVLVGEGATQRKVAKAQFKEILGLSLVFRF